MKDSPRGREIEKLSGDPGPIISRGNQITSLGEQMLSSAALLRDIADGASGQKGLAVDKLQDVVGQVHEELKLAGDRYKPTGPVLVTYGTVLSEVQPKISTAVTNCEDEWDNYQAKLGAADDADPGFRMPSLGEPSEEDKQKRKDEDDAFAAANAVAEQAYQAWKSEAITFDTHYDTWESAFNDAANAIDDATDGGIQDDGWDIVDGMVADALFVLKWVGLGLAVLGVIIGGPIIAAIAAVVAIATLILTIYSFARGNSSVLDLVFAVVGVIPFGSLGKLFNGNKMGFLDDMAGGLTSASGRADIMGEFVSISRGWQAGLSFGSGGPVSSFFTSHGFPGISKFTAGVNGARSSLLAHNGDGAANILSRLFTGKNGDDIFNPNFYGSGANGLDDLSILAGGAGEGLLKNLYGTADALFGINDRVGTPKLETPLFGSSR